MVAVGGLRLIAAREIDDVAPNVLLHNIPRSAAQSDALTLSDGEEPIAAMFAQDVARLFLYEDSLALAQLLPGQFGKGQLPQETNALAVAAARWCQVLFGGDASHLVLREFAHGEHRLAHHGGRQLREEVGLVLHGVGGGAEPRAPLGIAFGAGIMACSDAVVGVAVALFETAELNQAVAHHVAIGRKATAQAVGHVAHHALPIVTLQIDLLYLQTIAAGHGGSHLPVLFLGAIPRALLPASYLNIEEVGAMPLLKEAMHHHGTIHAATN